MEDISGVPRLSTPLLTWALYALVNVAQINTLLPVSPWPYAGGMAKYAL